LLGAGGSGVGAFDGDVQIPVRGNAAGELVGTKLVTSRDVASFELEHRVDLVRADGHVLGGPTEDLTIEVRGGGLIGGAKFDPAKSARSMIFDVWHEGESVLLGERGGKREEKSGYQGQFELVQVAQALDSRVEIKLVFRKGTKAGRRRNDGEKIKTRSF